MKWKVGDLVTTTNWGPALVCRVIQGGTYIVAWYGLDMETETLMLHHELAVDEVIVGPHQVSDVLLELQRLVMLREKRKVLP